MKITKKWLEDKHACQDFVFWLEKSTLSNPKKIIKKLMDYEEYSWCDWLLQNLLSKKQLLKYFIFSAKIILPYINNCQDNNIFRLAIDNAKKTLKNSNKKYIDIAILDLKIELSYTQKYISGKAYASACESDLVAYEIKQIMKIKILNYGISLLKGIIEWI